MITLLPCLHAADLGAISGQCEDILSYLAARLDSGEDNRPMHKESDLLPWILGALTMAIVAVAIAVGTTHGSAPRTLQMPTQTAAPPLPAVVAIEAPPPAPSLEPASPPEQVQPVAAPPVQSGQIWECTANGQRTFSSKPCGDKSTLRDVGPVNIMNPTPILQPGRTYQADANYTPDYSYPDTQETANNSYPVVVGIPYAVRMRPERTHRPYVRDHGAPPRKN
jgi:hypothetical protein